MITEPTFSGSNTVTPSCSVLLNHSLSPSPGHMIRSPHVSTSLTPLEVDPVASSEADINSCFGIPSQAMPDTNEEQDQLCHDLLETKIKLHDLEGDASTFEIQKCAFIEQNNPLQSELKSVKAERDSLRETVKQQAGAPLSDRIRRNGSSTVSSVSSRYLGVATKALPKLPVC